MQGKKIIVHSIIFCFIVSVLAFCSFTFVFSSNNDVAKGQTANLTFTMDDQLNEFPVDFDWFINIKDSGGRIVYSKSFNGAFSTGPSVGLTAGDKYSVMVYAPTTFSTYLTLSYGGNDISVNNNYMGGDFVMPSTGANIEILFGQKNNSVFFDDTTI